MHLLVEDGRLREVATRAAFISVYRFLLKRQKRVQRTWRREVVSGGQEVRSASGPGRADSMAGSKRLQKSSQVVMEAVLSSGGGSEDMIKGGVLSGGGGQDVSRGSGEDPREMAVLRRLLPVLLASRELQLPSTRVGHESASVSGQVSDAFPSPSSDNTKDPGREFQQDYNAVGFSTDEDDSGGGDDGAKVGEERSLHRMIEGSHMVIVLGLAFKSGLLVANDSPTPPGVATSSSTMPLLEAYPSSQDASVTRPMDLFWAREAADAFAAEAAPELLMMPPDCLSKVGCMFFCIL